MNIKGDKLDSITSTNLSIVPLAPLLGCLTGGHKNNGQNTGKHSSQWY
jgi:hypothetical protein